MAWCVIYLNHIARKKYPLIKNGAFLRHMMVIEIDIQIFLGMESCTSTVSRFMVEQPPKKEENVSLG